VRACVHSVGMLCGYMPNSSSFTLWGQSIIMYLLYNKKCFREMQILYWHAEKVAPKDFC